MFFPDMKTKIQLLNIHLKESKMHAGCTESNFMNTEYFLHINGNLPSYDNLYRKYILKE